MRQRLSHWLTAAAVAGISCGGGSSASSPPPPYALRTTGGTYNDGSGRVGLSVLATLRDAGGAGPQAAWSGTLSDGGGQLSSVQYDAPGSASWSALVWPDVTPSPGSYDVALAPASGSGTSASFSLADGSTLDIPRLSLSADAATLSWPAVAGSATYECLVYAGGALQKSALGPGTTCAVGDLPQGSYEAAVRAYSADPAALAASSSQVPSLPARFDVSEGYLAFSRSAGGSPAFTAVAAGGAIDYSGLTPGLAFWLAIAQSDGSVSTVSWTVQVIGPGLPVSAPLSTTYGANLPRQMFWSYDVPATPGIYSFTATSNSGTLAGSFTVGTPASLAIPGSVSASVGTKGAATLSWSAVTGAQSYLVSAWDHATGAYAASQWVNGSPASFPQGTFVSGSTYDVYVDATDADMIGGAVPTQVAVSENTFQPSSFTAP